MRIFTAKKLIYSLIFCLGFLIFSQSKVYAQEQFETKYNITYSITPSGETRVVQNISIINKQNDVLATNYILTIKEMEIYEITATDKKDKLETDINVNGSETVIKVLLKNQAVGEGKKNEIVLSFKSKQIANKVGEIWNINIPPVETSVSTTEYNVAINVPKEFGPKIYISPTPQEENNNVIKYNKSNIEGKSISASYGKYQILNFRLKYDLKNDSWLPGYQEIALPPQIFGRQQVRYKGLLPRPHHIRSDDDGNILAVYRLNPKQEISIDLNGSARLLGTQINPDNGAKMSELSANLIKNYTKEEKYWETSAPEIQNLAKTLFDPNKNVSQNAQTVYDYITKNLHYNFDIIKEDFVERRGALTALTTTDGAWACMEFTDLFIALTRAMGIPSRELNGYAFSNAENVTPLSISLKNGDLLHAWPEYYDPVFGWVPVDPTWGSTSGIDYFTKLDTNHFVFSIKGLDSEYPFPAGVYRLDNSGKQVEVDFAQNENAGEFNDNVKVEKVFNYNIFQIIRGKTKYKLTNSGGTILYNLNNTDKSLLPFDRLNVYVNESVKSIRYKDFNGSDKEIVIK